MFTFREFLLAEAQSEGIIDTDKSKTQDMAKKPVVEDKNELDSILAQVTKSDSDKNT